MYSVGVGLDDTFRQNAIRIVPNEIYSFTPGTLPPPNFGYVYFDSTLPVPVFTQERIMLNILNL
jgi:hypothetical protein